MRRVIVVCLILLSMTCIAQARYLEDNVQYVDDRFIVKLWPNTGSLDPVNDGTTARVSDAFLTSLNEKWSVVKVERLFHGPSPKNAPELDMEGYWRFWLAEPVDMENVLSEFAGAPIVEHVEPIGIHRVSYSPNDPSWSNQWYIRNTAGDHDIDTYEGWNIERGNSNVLLGIVDTGVQYSHPDLTARMWRNMDEVNGTPGYDDDYNGFVDDTVGWDWVTGISGCAASEDCSGEDADPKDYNGHGTHCSGIAAAHTNNGIGVAGIAGGGGTYTGARIMALRAGWESYTGYGYVAMDFCASGIDYAVDKGVCAINCSWGSSNSGGIGTAVSAAISAGIVVSVAAGNDNSSTPDYLGSRGDCIDVGGTNSSDNKYSGSNYGSWVDVSAPAQDIYSTYSNHYTNTYAYLTGTSMASPCVVGEAGLLKSLYPSWDRDEIQPAIINNVDAIWDGTSWEGLMGTGRINVNMALLSSGSITLTAPNGGETWYVDDSEYITWTSSNYSGTIDISIMRNYPGGFWDTIIDDTPDDGSYLWTVTGFTTTNARIRVMSSGGGIGDTSNANFTIDEIVTPTITVTVPNGGETWFTDTNEDITWTSENVTGDVKIELDRDYPDSWETLYASTANDGVQSWTVTGSISSDARIRVSSVDQPTVNDISNADFTIAEPYLNVYNPNGGETWYE
ncbi:S8 family serine peptidase, partial [bacterium]|nr:S8 family serine peptidase [bacterium]